MRALSHNRRTLLGIALATAAATTLHHESSGKHKKKKKKCHAPKTRCGKKQCCAANQVCTGGHCEDATTTSTTTPTPFTEVSCGGFWDTGISGARRYAQPFVASGSGEIATASVLLLHLSDNTPLAFEIRSTQNGAPTQQVLGTAFVIDIPATTPTEQTRAAIASFHPPVAVKQGVAYALVITDLAHKGFTLGERTSSSCGAACYYDPGDSNTFVPTGFPMIFSVSP